MYIMHLFYQRYIYITISYIINFESHRIVIWNSPSWKVFDSICQGPRPCKCEVQCCRNGLCEVYTGYTVSVLKKHFPVVCCLFLPIVQLHSESRWRLLALWHLQWSRRESKFPSWQNILVASDQSAFVELLCRKVFCSNFFKHVQLHSCSFPLLRLALRFLSARREVNEVYHSHSPCAEANSYGLTLQTKHVAEQKNATEVFCMVQCFDFLSWLVTVEASKRHQCRWTSHLRLRVQTEHVVRNAAPKTAAGSLKQGDSGRIVSFAEGCRISTNWMWAFEPVPMVSVSDLKKAHDSWVSVCDAKAKQPCFTPVFRSTNAFDQQLFRSVETAWWTHLNKCSLLSRAVLWQMRSQGNASWLVFRSNPRWCLVQSQATISHWIWYKTTRARWHPLSKLGQIPLDRSTAEKKAEGIPGGDRNTRSIQLLETEQEQWQEKLAIANLWDVGPAERPHLRSRALYKSCEHSAPGLKFVCFRQTLSLVPQPLVLSFPPRCFFLLHQARRHFHSLAAHCIVDLQIGTVRTLWRLVYLA